MSSIPLPSGDRGCEHCRGAGYLVRPSGSRAVAELCRCIPPCELCGGTGQRHVEQGKRILVGRCRCMMLPDRISLWNRAGIPARHSRSTFSSFKTHKNRGAKPTYTMCKQWLKAYRPGEENKGLILYGDVGRGKTHLLVAMLRELVFLHGVEVRFVEFSHLLSQLKEGYDAGTGEATTLMPLVRVPVLAIDELGKGRGSEWELGIIDQLVSHRYNALGTIMATTNYGPNQATGMAQPNLAQPDRVQSLGDRVGERVLSRLREMSRFLATHGDDYRTIR